MTIEENVLKQIRLDSRLRKREYRFTIKRSVKQVTLCFKKVDGFQGYESQAIADISLTNDYKTLFEAISKLTFIRKQVSIAS